MPRASNADFEIGFEEGGEVNLDETDRDRAIRMVWLDGSSMEEDEQVKDTPQTFLLPIAEISADCCDPPHPPAVFGIIACRIDGVEGSKHYRVGNFEHVVLQQGVLETFSPQELTTD